MNFSEKLIELRKKAGLSQEELGNKLNVTRQTVSKWELGQTTPEMDKIKEISSLFNVSTDSLLNDNKLEVKETNIKEEIKEVKKENKGREKLVLGIMVFILILCVSGLMYLGIKNHKENKNNFFDRFEDTKDQVENEFGDIKDEIENSTSNLEFFYKGTITGTRAKDAIDEIVSLNSKGNNISVNFIEKDYKPEEVEEIKKLIKDNSSYNFKFEYEGKKVVKVIIKREISEREIQDHNFPLEFSHTGTEVGVHVKSLFDEIIKINQKDERKVTLNFLGKDYNDITEIRKLKTQLKDFTNYEIYHEYDSEGFINKTIVEEVK